MFFVQLICRFRETVHSFLWRYFFLASTEPVELWARFSFDLLTTEVAGSEDVVDERPSIEWQRDGSEAGQKQCQKWHQHRLEHPHEEKLDENSTLGVLSYNMIGPLQSPI